MMRLFFIFLLLCFQTAKASINGSKSYLMSTGVEAAARLDMMQKIFGEHSRAQVDKVLAEGMVVFDIGCGSGAMTEYFAKKVGPTGHVYAIDISDENLKVTQEKLKNYSNISFHLGDVERFNFLNQIRPDLIYMRLVMMHLVQPDLALSNVFQRLKPGGYYLGQESIWDEVQTLPETPWLLDYATNVRKEISKKLGGVNPNIGRDLGRLSAEVGFKNINAYRTKYRFDKKTSQLFLGMGFKEIGKSCIPRGIVTKELIDSYLVALEELPDNFESISEQGHVIAQKPH